MAQERLGGVGCGLDGGPGACDGAKMGNLTALLSKIQPAVDAEKTVDENRSSSNGDFVAKVTEINVKKTLHGIMENSPILKEMIESGECGIFGGVHDIATGEVEFYEDEFEINNFKV